MSTTSSSPNSTVISSYKGYLNPKHFLPHVAMWYHIGSLFFSLLVFLLLFLVGGDPIISCSCSILFSIAMFVLLFRLNNSYYAGDKKLLEQLVVFHKIDAVRLLSAFFCELQQSFENHGLPYFGTSELLHLKVVDVSPLFTRIFRQESDLLVQLFTAQGGNFFRFLEALTPAHREILYRYYLNQSLAK